MNKRTVFLVVCLSILIILGFGSCKSKRELISSDATGRVSGKVLEQVLKYELDYKSLEIKGSAKTNALGKKYNFSITYRNLEDSLIWISARVVFGIEAARIICTRDSVWIRSRIAQFKEKGNWKIMSDLIGYPIDFYAFQGMMSRRLFIPGESGTKIIKRYLSRKNENGQLFIPDFSDPEQNKILQSKGFLPQFLIDANKKMLRRTRIAPEDAGWLLDVVYGSESYKNIGGLPERIKIEALDENDSMEFEMKVQSVKIDQELKFPFSWF